MTAPVVTSATQRPRESQPARHHVLRTRRVWRAHMHDHPVLVALAALVARAPAAPPRPLCRRFHRPHRRRPAGGHLWPAGGAVPRLCTRIHARPVNTPDSARPVRAAVRACVRSLCVRARAAAGHASAARCCRTLPGPGQAPPGSSQLPDSPLAIWGRLRSWTWAMGRQILPTRVHPCGTARSAQPLNARALARWSKFEN